MVYMVMKIVHTFNIQLIGANQLNIHSLGFIPNVRINAAFVQSRIPLRHIPKPEFRTTKTRLTWQSSPLVHRSQLMAIVFAALLK